MSVQKTTKKSLFIELFGKQMGTRLFQLLNSCCDSTGFVPVCTDDTLVGNGTPGNCLSVAPVIPSIALSGGGMFYGLTAGTDNPTSTDYAATVAVKTSVGTGRVPFPRDGAGAGTSATRIDASSFTLPNVGTYEVIFTVQTTEPGQLQVEIDGLGVAETTTGDQNPTSGGHLFVGHALITTTVPNSTLAIINPPGNSPALTITPADGASTHANAQRLIIRQVA
jgi:hypothetical protein